jgi:hypothetical protein
MEIRVDIPTVPRKTITVPIEENTKINDIIQDLVQEHAKLKPDDYFLYYPAGKTKWLLQGDKLLGEYSVSTKVR